MRHTMTASRPPKLHLRAARSLALAADARDPHTQAHAVRVAAYAVVLAETMGLAAGVITRLELGATLHDVGKIGVPDALLHKPGRFTAAEAAEFRRHVETGATILDGLIRDPVVLAIVRHHHERWDGTGYPDGLRGTQIPRTARIVCLADTIDAMGSIRAYRATASWEQIAAEVRCCAGTQFDPAVVEAFNRVEPQLRTLYEGFRPSIAA